MKSNNTYIYITYLYKNTHVKPDTKKQQQGNLELFNQKTYIFVMLFYLCYICLLDSFCYMTNT